MTRRLLAESSGTGLYVRTMEREHLPLDRRLRQEILFARERVYRFGQATPMERLHLPGPEPSPEIWVKREDLSAVKSYKWRGACNAMTQLAPEQGAKGVVTASAGNHAQGVALAAKALGISSRIYMPRSTPKVKQNAVRHHGGDFVQIVLSGDSYDEAVMAAREDERSNGATYVHAYDDLHTMAGQGTMADEIVLSGHGPFDVAYLQIGGGGMASAVSCWLKTYWPEIETVGVEGVGQASMKAALDKGETVELHDLDIFCDGTAVRKAGSLPFQVCQGSIDRMATVTNAEVSAAIRLLWETLRCISEPSGAMGLAALMKDREALVGKKVLLVITGANIDFLQLGHIAQSAGSMNAASRTLRVHIPEKPGAMLALLDSCFEGLNIADFQYGVNSAEEAHPVFTVTADREDALATLPERLKAGGYHWEDLKGAVDVTFRAISLRGDLLSHPVFLRLDFYERTGALHDFLSRLIRDRGSLCYFNYRQSGERIGRALIGLDFQSAEARAHFLDELPEHGDGYRSCKPVDEATMARMTG